MLLARNFVVLYTVITSCKILTLFCSVTLLTCAADAQLHHDNIKRRAYKTAPNHLEKKKLEESNLLHIKNKILL
jgi:hypothetical protein